MAPTSITKMTDFIICFNKAHPAAYPACSGVGLPPPLFSLTWHEALHPPEAPPRRQRSVSFPPWRRPASHAFQGFAVLRGRLSGSAAIVRLPALRLIL